MSSKRVISISSAFALLLGAGVAGAAPAKLLITAVSASPTQAEMVAVYNPGSASVDLTNFYLADYDTYYLVVTSTAPVSTDFVARFPAGASIAPGETQYVSIAGAECFNTACGTTGTFVGYGVYPTYELVSSTAANNSASVPDMLSPFAGAIGGSHGFTNGGEPVVLFYWDGSSNLVTDIDYVFYGGATSSNPTVNKTGVTVNGSTYLPDTADTSTLHAPISPSPAINTCRQQPFSEGAQVQSGGNGFNGSDETSENTATTFTACTSISVTPGTDAGTGGAGGTSGAGGADAGVDASVGGAAGSGGTATGGTAGTAAGGTAGTATGGTAGTATGGTAGTASGGTAGAASGGTAGTASGGTAGTAAGGSGGASGGAGGTGGASGGVGGSSVGGSSAGGSDAGKLDGGVVGGGGDDSGCGCSTVGERTNTGWVALLSLVGIAFGLRRRR